MNKKNIRLTAVFWLQSTRSFPEGAPQREDFHTDQDHSEACDDYAKEWLLQYRCPGCGNPDCPQHGPDIF